MPNYRGMTTGVMTLAAATARAFYMNTYPTPFEATFSVEKLTGGHEVTYSVQHTIDEISGKVASAANGSGVAWYDHSTVSGVHVSAAGNRDGSYEFPITGIRLNATVVSASSRMKFTVIQQGY